METGISPDATRAPPTASTARKASCTASSSAEPAADSHLALFTPCRQARRAAASTRAVSRPSAPDAFTVRNAPKARSSATEISPTASCDRSVARAIFGMTSATAPPTSTTTPSVTPSSTTSSKAIITIAATNATAPVAAETTACVLTARSSVVSEVTRDIRSPGGIRSNSAIRSRNSRPTTVRRAARTTDSAVRSSTYAPNASTAVPTTTSTVSPIRIPAMVPPEAIRSTSAFVANGCSSAPAAPTRAHNRPRATAQRCGRTYPYSALTVSRAGRDVSSFAGADAVFTTFLPSAVRPAPHGRCRADRA